MTPSLLTSLATAIRSLADCAAEARRANREDIAQQIRQASWKLEAAVETLHYQHLMEVRS